MRTKSVKTLALYFFGLAICIPVQGQFFKKLKNKAEKAAETTLLNRMENVVSKQTDKAMDKMLGGQFGGEEAQRYGERVDISVLPITYDFEWKYQMKFETQRAKENLDMTYYLKKDAKYWGAQFNQGMDMFMVYDNQHNLVSMFVENEGEKFASVTQITAELFDDDSDIMDYSDYKMKELPSKRILNYYCKGFSMENSEMKFIFYVTFEAEVSFSDVYGKSDQIPKGFDLQWLKEGDNEGIVMEMQMEDKKKKKNNMTMTCTALEKSPYSINSSEYNGM